MGLGVASPKSVQKFAVLRQKTACMAFPHRSIYDYYRETKHSCECGKNQYANCAYSACLQQILISGLRNSSYFCYQQSFVLMFGKSSYLQSRSKAKSQLIYNTFKYFPNGMQLSRGFAFQKNTN